MQYKSLNGMSLGPQDKVLSTMERPQRINDYLQEQYLQKLAVSEALAILDFTFDQPLAGDGWHNREFDGHTYWRFTGPSTTATLVFRKIAPVHAKVKVLVFHAITPAHLDNLVLAYNGFKLMLINREGSVLEYSIPDAAINSSAYTKLEFTTLPPLCPQGDNRMLGVALQRIEIY